MSYLVPAKRNGALKHTNGSIFPTWIDELFPKHFADEFLTGLNHTSTMPSVNIIENSDSYELQMAIPGFKKSDFNIELDHDVLSISVEANQENSVENQNFTRREFSYSSFKRTFNLPENVIDTNGIKASYLDGILNISIPKREEAKRKPSRNIEIS